MQKQKMAVVKPSEWKRVNGGVYKDAFIPDEYMKPYGPYHQKLTQRHRNEHIVNQTKKPLTQSSKGLVKHCAQ